MIDSLGLRWGRDQDSVAKMTGDVTLHICSAHYRNSFEALLDLETRLALFDDLKRIDYMKAEQ
jgi:hypothetical protein